MCHHVVNWSFILSAYDARDASFCIWWLHEVLCVPTYSIEGVDLISVSVQVRISVEDFLANVTLTVTDCDRFLLLTVVEQWFEVVWRARAVRTWRCNQFIDDCLLPSDYSTLFVISCDAIVDCVNSFSPCCFMPCTIDRCRLLVPYRLKVFAKMLCPLLLIEICIAEGDSHVLSYISYRVHAFQIEGRLQLVSWPVLLLVIFTAVVLTIHGFICFCEAFHFDSNLIV